MKNIGLAAMLVITCLTTPSIVIAENTTQQNKMTTCNKAAGDMKGDERKAFMSNCLKKDAPMMQQDKMTQQDKMKQCNKDAAGKKGDERKAFMSACLKKNT